MATRILYVITKANWGGAQRYVYDLATGAKNEGFEVAVACGEAGVLSANLHIAGIRIIPVPALARDIAPGRDVKAYQALKELFVKEKPDIVHLNSAKAAGLGAFAARRARVPRIIFTAHGWAFNEERPFWQRILIWLFSGITVLLSNKTICVSDAVRRDIYRFPFTAKKLVVIHNGIACTPQLPREQAREAILPNHQHNYWIGMVSELHTTKRISDGVRAFAKIKDEFPNAIFVAVGEGEERAELEKLIDELHIRDRVFFPGFVQDVKTKLSAFDLFIHTSRSEALAYAVLEAGCASLPVISTRVGGIPEIIEDKVSGVLIPPFRQDLAANELRALINNPGAARELGKALKTRVESTFSLPKMIRKTLSLY